jgi:hypothetical protein
MNHAAGPVFTPVSGCKQPWINVGRIPRDRKSRACVIS